MTPPDPDLLITRLLEGEASAAEVAAVRVAVAADPALAQRFARAVVLHRLTGAAIAGRAGDSRFAAEVVARCHASPAGQDDGLPLRVEQRLRRAMRLTRWTRRLAVAAVLTLVAGLAWVVSSRGGATLERCESVVWLDNTHAPAVGDPLSRGKVVELRSGMVELHFNAAVVVLLEGPARLEITGSKSARLDYGRLVARVTGPQGKGFVIDGPTGRVVDLGTAFGVSVERSGGMEVHVLEGTVNASSHHDRKTVVALHRDEALRIDEHATNRMAADAGAFLTELPPMSAAAAGFIRWSFEESGGAVVANSGRGLAADRADARLLAVGAGHAPATHVAGRRGRGLAFDGVDDFVESDFEGIAGQAPRTVALWARVPVDLTPAQSYAMVSWGKVEGAGTAWQISINPIAAEGPPGALRAGTGRGAVVGSTDLRDGKWHHLAAVMYGGAAPSTATHVLLYVDGVLESTTRKSVRVIHTEPATEPHGIWLGRNLSVESPDPSGARFFRGDLDEVEIIAAALDQPAIRGLMEGNALKP